MNNIPTDDVSQKKAARKAQPGGRVKWRNVPRNWAHQAISYMDAGEVAFRLVIESIEVLVLGWVLYLLLPSLNIIVLGLLSLFVVHTWNWITNGLFWSVIIFTFPGLKNPGTHKTVEYLNKMRDRLGHSRCISGIAIYGSVTRQAWHDRSDIDIRLLRRAGSINLLCAGFETMEERFRALLALQPMDLYLADNIDFLMKMRSDEIPVLLLNRDERLSTLYPGNAERQLVFDDLRSENKSSEDRVSGH